MARVEATIYTDPGCSFGFNARRREAQLAWHYGLACVPYPLATAEVAELRGVSLDRAREEAQQVGATLTPVAGDGYRAMPSA
jgi:hypothetical protein